MKLELIQLFTRSAALGSISAAAAELGLSSSLASRQLAALERELGAQLMRRTTRSLQVTAAGERVLRWAETSLRDFDLLRDDLAALREQPAGLVRIACTEFLANGVVAEVLADLALRHPLIRSSVLTTDRAVQLGRDEVDLALHVGPPPDTNVAVRRVREVRTLLCASPAYLARHGRPSSPFELGAHRLLAHATYEPRNWFFRSGGGEVLVHALVPHITTSSTAVLHRLALLGVGIARLSARLAEPDLESGALVSLLDDHAQTLANGEFPSVWMIFPDRHLLQCTRLVADALLQRMQVRP